MRQLIFAQNWWGLLAVGVIQSIRLEEKLRNYLNEVFCWGNDDGKNWRKKNTEFKSPEGTCVSFFFCWFFETSRFPPQTIIVSFTFRQTHFSLGLRAGNDSTAESRVSTVSATDLFAEKIQSAWNIICICTECRVRDAINHEKVQTNLHLISRMEETWKLSLKSASPSFNFASLFCCLCTLSFNCRALIMKIIREISHEFLLCINCTVPRGSLRLRVKVFTRCRTSEPFNILSHSLALIISSGQVVRQNDTEETAAKWKGRRVESSWKRSTRSGPSH